MRHQHPRNRSEGPRTGSCLGVNLVPNARSRILPNSLVDKTRFTGGMVPLASRAGRAHSWRVSTQIGDGVTQGRGRELIDPNRDGSESARLR